VIRHVYNSHLLETIHCDLPINPPGALQPFLVSESTHKDNIPHCYGKMPIHFFALGNVSNTVEVMTEGQVMDEYFT
jgi:hypothetical protein